MSLITSISGIRGTVGGMPGGGLTPIDIVKFTTAFAMWVDKETQNKKIVVGRDGRISGATINNLVTSTLVSLGFEVVDIGLSTTPTVEIAVVMEHAGGGIIITASHNPKEWNALKLLNKDGEFLSSRDGVWVLECAKNEQFEYVNESNLGSVSYNDSYIDKHIQLIVAYRLVDTKIIANKKFKIVVDVINSTGSLAVPKLLNALGVFDVIVINKEISGNFAHNPEPLPENLTELSRVVVEEHADLGIAVDPDVDRLSFVCEDGTFFGEEYTLVAVADYILSCEKTNTVSNLSSTRALRDVTERHGGKYFGSAVGEVNVVEKMKEVGTQIGGEGNGGVIVPDLHYGRDALVGIALFLTHLARFDSLVSQLRKTYPNYCMSKNKITLTKDIDVKKIFEKISKKYEKFPINTIDGLKIEFDDGWVHLRTSNTEPIIRIYSENVSNESAQKMAQMIMQDIHEIIDGVSDN
ncbi:MAG: phosphoglucosamine mutase [bacterium]